MEIFIIVIIYCLSVFSHKNEKLEIQADFLFAPPDNNRDEREQKISND